MGPPGICWSLEEGLELGTRLRRQRRQQAGNAGHRWRNGVQLAVVTAVRRRQTGVAKRGKDAVLVRGFIIDRVPGQGAVDQRIAVGPRLLLRIGR
jgi:hypothetical protein